VAMVAMGTAVGERAIERDYGSGLRRAGRGGMCRA
jgi:phage baseplate assembly protein W